MFIMCARLYTYKYCSPSRSSFLTGRLPVHVNQNNNCNLVTYPGGADLRMALLPERLRGAGYRTAMTGKWHCGARSAANLPANRGFDSHFGFLKGGEDHITQRSGDAGLSFVDLWRDHAPAYGENGTFSTFIYAREAVRVISEHGARLAAAAAANGTAAAEQQQPLFLYLAWQATHAPLEAPARFVRAVPDDTAKAARAHMNGLAAALDEGVANVTAALKGAGMWETTLLLFMADNGGWLGPDFGGNNWPLRGGKVSDFEGGVRATAFLTGGDGALPGGALPALRGTAHSGLVHVADWVATLCAVAGCDASDEPAVVRDGAGVTNGGGIPPLDSVNVLASLLTPNATSSARTEVPLAFCSAAADCDAPDRLGDAALIVQDRPGGKLYKLVTGYQGGWGYWQGPRYPNASTANVEDPGCPSLGEGGCLFEVRGDPTEHVDLAKDPAHASVLAAMRARLAAIGAGVWQTNNTGGADTCTAPKAAYKADRGFLAPRCEV